MKSDRTGILIGEHRHHDKCRFCLQKSLSTFIDFGYVPLAGGFLKKTSTEADFRAEKRYPLDMVYCERCSLVQVNNAIPGEVLFKDYFYFSSAIKTLVDHFQKYALELKERFPNPSQTTIAELGCNDGVFLKPLRELGFKTIGIDPATNVVKPLIEQGFQIVNEFFTHEVTKNIHRQFGQVDALVTSNSFAHIDDMHEVMKGVKEILKPEGFLAFETHYLPTLLKEMQYDMMYHEHMSYYSLTSIENFMSLFDMEVFDVKRIPIHAGSARYYVQNKKHRPISESVRAMRREEQALGIGFKETYLRFGAQVEKTRKDLLNLLNQLKKGGKKIAGYGASGRATALSAYCGLDRSYLDYVIDDAPAKQGAYTPGNHLKIVDSSILKTTERPDYVLLFAWSFADEISKKNIDYLNQGGKFIAPLPEVRIL